MLITSSTPYRARSSTGTATHSAPATKAPESTTAMASGEGSVPTCRPSHVAAMAPA